MTSRNLILAQHAIRPFRATALLVLAAMWMSGTASAQETVGRIEGRTFTASGQVRVEREPDHNTTTLLSGSEVVVHEGYARLTLTDGSEVDVCGPAKISLLKSGGAITLALEHGRIHGRLAPALPITVYTPLATATPVAIGNGQRDVVVGLDPRGDLCVNAVLGAVRLEHQFSGERLLAPQYAQLSLAATSLDSLRTSPGACTCDAPAESVIVGVAKKEPEAGQPTPTQQKPPDAPAPGGREPSARSGETPAPREEPRIIAVMPPLTFDARNPEPPVITRPEAIEIIREVRIVPNAVFTGRVESKAEGQVAAGEEEKKPGFGARFKNFFARLFGRKSKD